MNSITTAWLTPEKIKEYKEAIPHVNVGKLCRKHGVHRQYINRVLEGTIKQAIVYAKVALVLNEALAEYQYACDILGTIKKEAV